MNKQTLCKAFRVLSPVALSTITVFLFAGTLSASDHGDRPCSNRTLKGDYGLYADGTVIGVGPNAVIALFTYDGEGNLTGTGTSKVNGNVSHFTLTGTYSVDEGCNAAETVLFPSGATATHQSVIVDNGNEFFFLNSTPGTATSGNVSVGVGKKQFPTNDD
jgi:hypothetical protein